MRYSRNRIYISENEQQQLKKYKVFLAGSGIGSIIAECALRLGFEHLTIVDGDKVEETNLNRQNYTHADIGRFKAESLSSRLKSINPLATINTHNQYLTAENMGTLLAGHDAAINALDFQSDIPFAFDALCRQWNMPVLHPYNIGWAGLVFILLPNGPMMEDISPHHEGFEKKVVQLFINTLDDASDSKAWLEKVLADYELEKGKLSPPQLSVGSWLLGGLCADLLYRLATGREAAPFPHFHFLSAR